MSKTRKAYSKKELRLDEVVRKPTGYEPVGLKLCPSCRGACNYIDKHTLLVCGRCKGTGVI